MKASLIVTVLIAIAAGIVAGIGFQSFTTGAVFFAVPMAMGLLASASLAGSH